MAPEQCPNCGEELRPRAKSCPECGADARTGWSDEAQSQSLGLPDDSFDYNEFVEREFGSKKQNAARGIKPLWKIVAALLVAGFFYFLIRNWF